MFVEIYGTPTCSYCKQAIELVKKYNYSYEYFDLTPEYIAKIQSLSGQTVRTVPQIIIDEEYIGGYEEFYTEVMLMEGDDNRYE